MKTKEDWKTEIAKVLTGKVDAVIEEYEAKRDQGFSELSELSAQLDTLEGEKEKLLKEKSVLNPLRNADLKEMNIIETKLPRLEKEIRAYRKRIDDAVVSLTAVPDFENPSRILNFLSEVDFSSRPSYADMIRKRAELHREEEALEAKLKDAS